MSGHIDTLVSNINEASTHFNTDIDKSLEFYSKVIKTKSLPSDCVIDCKGMSEDEKQAFVFIDNVNDGEYDFEVIEEWDFDVEELMDFGVEFEVEEENEYQGEGDNSKGLENIKEDEYDAEVETIKTDIVTGDLLEFYGNDGQYHRLLCGDSTDKETVEKLMDGKEFDMVVTDPPYNVAYVGKTKDALTIQNDKMDGDSFYHFLLDFYTVFDDVTKKGGAWYVWHADSEGLNFRKAMVDAGILLKQCLIWVKNSLVMGRRDYHWKHESCLYGWKEGAAHNWYSDRKQTTILEFNRPSRNAEHPTMKPIELIAYQIGNSSKKADIIGDGFLGSGTTMVAAHQLNRNCYGLELEPKYCQVIVDRMIKLDPTLKVKKNGNEYVKEVTEND